MSKVSKKGKPVENEQVKRPPRKAVDFTPPAALKPQTEWDGTSREITSEVYTEPVGDWDQLVTELGFDAELYEIVDPVKISKWDNPSGGSYYSYKAGVRVRSTVKLNLDEDYQELVKEIKRYKAPATTLPDSDDTFVVLLGDWQMGKNDGYGMEGTIRGIVKMIDDVEQRIKDLRKIGRPLGKLVVVSLGDMIENCQGNYTSQPFNVEANRRVQIRWVRRLIRDALVRWSKMFSDVAVLAVPGNHGENRQGNKAYTTTGDNDDVGIVEQVCDIFAANEAAFGHIKFYLPEDELYLNYDISGTLFTFYHGHITGAGADPSKKIIGWWRDQTFGNQPAGDSKILCTGHYHHFRWEETGERIWIQIPAMDGGSEWWVDMKGLDSRPGTVTFRIDSDGVPKDLEIL